MYCSKSTGFLLHMSGPNGRGVIGDDIEYSLSDEDGVALGKYSFSIVEIQTLRPRRLAKALRSL